MVRLSFRIAFAVVLGGVGALGLACSGGGGGSGTGSSSSGQTCTNANALKILFNPMYSAYDGVHTYQVPAIIDGIDNNAITWTASDPSMVSLQPDDSTGGILITTQKAGTVTINAQAGGLCGSSTLTITSATADDWNAGNARYNNGVVLRGPHHTDDGGAPSQASCTNCHGPSAQNGPFKDVAHTPEQIGGFSDDDLVGIFQHGTVPDGGYFDPGIVHYDRWQSFHQWEMSADEAKGIVVYLRSLTPQAQTGSSNWGGHHHGDGGPDGPPGGGSGGGGSGGGGSSSGGSSGGGSGSGGSGSGSGGGTPSDAGAASD